MLSSLSIDGVALHDLTNYAITEVGPGFFGSPVVRENSVERAQSHGAINLAEFYGSRVIDFKGIAIGSSVADAIAKIDTLKGLFQIGQGTAGDYEQIGVNTSAPLHKMDFVRAGTGYTERCYVAQSGSFDAPMDVVSRVIPWGVTLVASDPRYYQLDPTVGQQDYAQATILAGANANITVLGNTPSPPWFTIQGPFNSWAKVQARVGSISGAIIGADRVVLTLPALNNVDIITRTKIAVKNQTIRHDIIDRTGTDWFLLPTGTVNIEFTTGGGTTGATSLRVRWQHARV